MKIRKSWDPTGILVGGKKLHMMLLYPSESIWGALCPWHPPRCLWDFLVASPRCLIGHSHSSQLAPFISTNGNYWEPTNSNASCRGMEGERGEQEMSHADVGEWISLSECFPWRGSWGKREQDADSIPPAILHIYWGIEMSLFSSSRLKAVETSEPPKGAW